MSFFLNLFLNSLPIGKSMPRLTRVMPADDSKGNRLPRQRVDKNGTALGAWAAGLMHTDLDGSAAAACLLRMRKGLPHGLKQSLVYKKSVSSLL